jgi:hypothetical protein
VVRHVPGATPIDILSNLAACVICWHPCGRALIRDPGLIWQGFCFNPFHIPILEFVIPELP